MTQIHPTLLPYMGSSNAYGPTPGSAAEIHRGLLRSTGAFSLFNAVNTPDNPVTKDNADSFFNKLNENNPNKDNPNYVHGRSLANPLGNPMSADMSRLMTGASSLSFWLKDAANNVHLITETPGLAGGLGFGALERGSGSSEPAPKVPPEPEHHEKPNPETKPTFEKEETKTPPPPKMEEKPHMPNFGGSFEAAWSGNWLNNGGWEMPKPAPMPNWLGGFNLTSMFSGIFGNLTFGIK